MKKEEYYKLSREIREIRKDYSIDDALANLYLSPVEEKVRAMFIANFRGKNN